METYTSREQFNRQAAHYDQQWNNWNEENLRWLLAHGGTQATGRVLDVATGSGFTALAFAPAAKEVVGIDVSSGMLAQAREKAQGSANVRFQEAPAESMPFLDQSFDLITCRVAAHHFDSVTRFLAEAHRVLKPDGKLLIADTCVPDDDAELDRWQNEVEWLRDRSHVRNYSPREWCAFLAEAGFEVEATDFADGLVPITFEAWLRKSGCTGEPATQLRAIFEAASPSVRRAFRIEWTESGDIHFAWMRVLICARKK